MIEIKNLVKRYDRNTAVDNISFEVNDGEIMGFLGPNGAGKSTTMNILTGYLSATEGQCLINGVDILEHPIEAKKKIGFLPEIPPLYLEMTVLDIRKEQGKHCAKEGKEHCADLESRRKRKRQNCRQRADPCRQRQRTVAKNMHSFPSFHSIFVEKS